MQIVLKILVLQPIMLFVVHRLRDTTYLPMVLLLQTCVPVQTVHQLYLMVYLPSYFVKQLLLSIVLLVIQNIPSLLHQPLDFKHVHLALCVVLLNTKPLHVLQLQIVSVLLVLKFILVWKRILLPTST